MESVLQKGAKDVGIKYFEPEKMHFSQNFSIKGHFFEVLPMLGFFGPGCILRKIFLHGSNLTGTCGESRKQ